MALVKFREITRAAYNNLINKEANTQYYITETDGTFSIAFGDRELKGNQPLITGAASTITSNNLTVNRALISNGNGKVAVSAVTSTQLGYLSGVTSSVQTQLNGKSQRIILTGQLQTTSYRRSVIALCELTNTNASANSYSVGTLTFHRTNGLSSAVKYDFAIEKRYNTEGFNLSQTVLANSGFVGGIRPCTFVKNGIKYGGIEIFFSDAELRQIEFHGTTNFEIFGLDYYIRNTSTPLDTEVNNSLVFDDSTNIRIADTFKVGNDLVASQSWVTTNTRSSSWTPTWGQVSGKPAFAPSNAQKNSDITKAEIEAKLTGNITSHTHSQYLTSFTETDPTVPSWAKAANKPKYTAAEVGARPGTWTPTAAQVGAVPTSRTVNGKALSSNISLSAGEVGAYTKTEVDNKIAAIPAPDLTPYAKLTGATFTGDITTPTINTQKVTHGATLTLESPNLALTVPNNGALISMFSNLIVLGNVTSFTGVPTPTSNTSAANKKYVDDKVAAISTPDMSAYAKLTGAEFTGDITTPKINTPKITHGATLTLESPNLALTVPNGGATIGMTNKMIVLSNVISFTGVPTPTMSTGAANKKYVDDKVAAIPAPNLTPYAKLTGATFTGVINVPAPTANTHAATKKYVDDKAAASGEELFMYTISVRTKIYSNPLRQATLTFNLYSRNPNITNWSTLALHMLDRSINTESNAIAASGQVWDNRVSYIVSSVYCVNTSMLRIRCSPNDSSSYFEDYTAYPVSNGGLTVSRTTVL